MNLNRKKLVVWAIVVLVPALMVLCQFAYLFAHEIEAG